MTHSRGGRLMSVGKEKAPGDFSLGAYCGGTYTASTLYSTFMRTQIQRVRTI